MYPDGTYVSNTDERLDIVRVADRMGFVNGYAYNGCFPELITERRLAEALIFVTEPRLPVAEIHKILEKIGRWSQDYEERQND